MCDLEKLAHANNWPDCRGPLHRHHIFNRSKASLPRLRKYVDRPEFWAAVCMGHNVGRYADTRDAMRFLLLRKAAAWGTSHMRVLVNKIPWKYPRRDLTWEALVE